MSVRINQPFDEFTDTAGKPIENGYIYIGTINLNPETNAIAVYANAALTVPIAQPIRTIGGYPSYLGAPTRLYTAGDYSITVKSSSGVLVFSDWTTLNSVYDYVATSLPTPNTIASRDANGATQLADSTGANSGYAVTSAQTVATTPGILGSTSLATVSTLMARDSSGRARVVDPSNAADISTKNYVDTTASTINTAWAAADATHAALTTAHGAVSTATASTIVIRDSSSRARVADPSDGADIATKGYVDSNSNVAASFISGATIDNLTTFGYIYSGGSTSPTGSEATTYPATNGATTGAITSSFNTTSPLAGTKDFKLAKGSASSGIGWYYLFTIDPAYFGSVLQIQFPYWNTTTDSDFQVFLWDVTNANFISLSTQAINATPASGTGVSPGTFFATFIAPAITTSRQFRLYVHSTVAGTVGNLNLDNITVGRYTTPNAAAVGGWTAYTPSFGAGLGTVTTISFQYRRVGDSIDIKGSFNTGTVAASAASFTLPNGLTTTTRDGPFGKWRANTGTATTAKSGNLYCSANVNTITFSTDDYGPAISPFVASPNATAIGLTNTTATNVELNAVPIAQWTTNINLATDFTEYLSYSPTGATLTAGGANSTAGNMYYGIDGSTIPSVAITSTTATTNTTFDVTTRKPSQPGDQLILEFNSGNGWNPVATNQNSVGSDQLGSVPIGMQVFWANSTTVRVSISNAGRLKSATAGTGSADWSTVNGLGWKWRVRKVSNGNMAETPPVVRAEYTGAATVIPSALAILNAATKVEDTHSAVSNPASGWLFTAPIAGVYTIDFTTSGSSATSTAAVFGAQLYKNGSSIGYIAKFGTSAALSGCEMSGSNTVRLLAGQTLQIQISSTGNTSGNYNSNRITVTRIGS